MRLALGILLALLSAAPASGACTFGGAISDLVSVANATSIASLPARTWLQWNFPTSDVGLEVFMSKGSSVDFKRYFADVNELDSQVVRAVLSAVSTTAGIDRPLNVWQLIGLTYDETNGIKLYRGTLTASMAETASYTTAQVGSGATSSDAAAPLLIGNRNGSVGAFVGPIQLSVVYPRVLSLAEMETHRMRPRVLSGGVLFQQLGFPNCSGTQGDWSGAGNTGAPTLNSTVFANGPAINYRGTTGRRR